MRSSILYATAFVATVFAAPHFRGPIVARDIVYDIDTVTRTVYVTEYEPTSTHHAASVHKVKTTPPPPPPPPPPPAPVPKTTAPAVIAAAPVQPPPEQIITITYMPEAPKVVTPVYVPPPVETHAPAPAPAPAAPAPAPAANDGSPLSGGVSILSTCNKYRELYGLPKFTWSTKLEANAAKTGQEDGGVNEIHHLFDGSFAQVISPGLASAVPGVDIGGDSPFEIAYLAWMCEQSSDSQISQLCPTMQSAMNMQYSGTGHYQILTSTSYTQIACAFTQNPGADSTSPYQGLWTCDLAF